MRPTCQSAEWRLLEDGIRHHGPLVLDGAMGTMIQRVPLTEAMFRGTSPTLLPPPHSPSHHDGCSLQDVGSLSRAQYGNNDLLSLTQPHLIRQIHAHYIASGADIITTNTFNAQRVSQEALFGAGYLVQRMNMAAVRLCREALDCRPDAAEDGRRVEKRKEKRILVAGSVGPTTVNLSLIHDGATATAEYQRVRNAYAEQVEALLYPHDTQGVDVLLVETVVDLRNALAALDAITDVVAAHGPASAEKKRSVPVIVSASPVLNGHLLSGEDVDAFHTTIASSPHADLVFAIGLNCMDITTTAAEESTTQILRRLSQLNKKAAPGGTRLFYTSCHPNAGIPNADRQYDMEAVARVREKLQEWVEEEGLLEMVGGCCGTGPAEIEALARRKERR